MKIERYNVKCVYLTYKQATGKEEYISVTEWANGDGFDFDFNGDKFISLAWEEIEKMNLAKQLIYENDE